MESEILTVEEAAKFLQLAPKTIRAKAGRIIPAAKIAGRWRFIKVDLLNWLRQSGTEQSAPAPTKGVKAWQSINAVKSGGRVSPTTESAYTNLLALPTSKLRKSGTTS